MRRGGVFGWLVLLGTLTTLSACSNSSGTLRDDQVVYCLSPQRQAELGAAAAALDKNLKTTQGLIVSSTATMRPIEWREKDPAAFIRACNAMTPLPQGGAAANQLPAVVSILLPVLAGGVVALLSTEWRNVNTVAVKHADDLSDAADAFLDAVTRYTQARAKNTDARAEPLDDSHRELARQLARVGRYRPRWGKVTETREILMKDLTREKVHAGGMDAPLKTVMDRVARFDRALRRPWSPHKGVR